jgi:hypothetical protein
MLLDDDELGILEIIPPVENIMCEDFEGHSSLQMGCSSEISAALASGTNDGSIITDSSNNNDDESKEDEDNEDCPPPPPPIRSLSIQSITETLYTSTFDRPEHQTLHELPPHPSQFHQQMMIVSLHPQEQKQLVFQQLQMLQMQLQQQMHNKMLLQERMLQQQHQHHDDNHTFLDQKKMEQRWAKELYELPQMDRIAHDEEVHGVSSRAIDEYENETEASSSSSSSSEENEGVGGRKSSSSKPRPTQHELFIQTHLDELNKWIHYEFTQGPQGSNNWATYNGYERSLQLLPSPPMHSTAGNTIDTTSQYVFSNGFRLNFLRADRFHVPKAAIRYLKCLDIMLENFGDVALCRKLYITDLNGDERQMLKDGSACQVLPSRDRLGRMITVWCNPKRVYMTSADHIQKIFRVAFYLMLTVVSEDVTTQKNGCVCIAMIHPSAGYADFNNGTAATTSDNTINDKDELGTTTSMNKLFM